MKKIILFMLFVILATPTQAKTVARETIGGYTISATQSRNVTKVKWCGKTYRKYHFKGEVRIVSEGRLTTKMLRKRKGKVLYIERIIGTVVNDHLDGRTTENHYISYRCLKGKAHKGDTVVTYCVYNPYTRWIDDISDRFDIIL